MKVLIVGPAWPLRGGLSTFDERLCREFITMGHSCEILSFSLQYPSLLFPGKTQFSSDPKPVDLVIHPVVNSVNPLNWLLAGRKMAAHKYDLVVFRYWMSFMGPAYGTLARAFRKKGSRVVAITDNIVPHEKRVFDKPFTSYFLNGVQAFLSMSKEVQQQARALQPGKEVRYAPHPMYDMFGPERSRADAKQALGLDADTTYLLFFGFIRKYKGLGLLLNSFAKTDRRKHKVKLIVAGEFYEDATPYLEQIKTLGLENYLVMKTDFIPNAEVGLYFSAADLVVQTYLSATQSGVTQIAYFYNKPMLVTNVGGLAELVPNGKVGYVCEVDENAIANALNQYLEERPYEQFSAGVKEEKQKFTWAYLAGQLMELR